MWGPAAVPLSGHVPAATGGRDDHVLLVVIIRSHRVQEPAEGPPADGARSFPLGPMLDALEAEAVEAEGHIGCVLDVIQADGTQEVFCCLQQPGLLLLAGAGSHVRGALLHGFLGIRFHVLPRHLCHVPDLVRC